MCRGMGFGFRSGLSGACHARRPQGLRGSNFSGRSVRREVRMGRFLVAEIPEGSVREFVRFSRSAGLDGSFWTCHAVEAGVDGYIFGP